MSVDVYLYMFHQEVLCILHMCKRTHVCPFSVLTQHPNIFCKIGPWTWIKHEKTYIYIVKQASTLVYYGKLGVGHKPNCCYWSSPFVSHSIGAQVGKSLKIGRARKDHKDLVKTSPIDQAWSRSGLPACHFLSHPTSHRSPGSPGDVQSFDSLRFRSQNMMLLLTRTNVPNKL